ncbi:ABC transporter substrate-binding protein [Desulfobacterales bacterium HSG17]|nr:ABC transporter substrate-binding protein [Desulfobacterales bacterium HSG17]
MEQTVNKTNVRKIILFAVLFFGALLITAGSAFTQEEKPKYGGTMRVISEIDANGFDILKARSSIGLSTDAGHLVMEKLFNMGPNGELIPVLGLSAASSEDGKTWTIKLRKGVKFHDGTPFNADAVVHHWQRILNPDNLYSFYIFIKPVASVQKTGEYEVQFNLHHPWLAFKATITSSKGFVPLIPSPKAVEGDLHHRAPVGTGPFTFKEWKSGNRIVLTKNPDYWQKGKPYLDEIVFLIIKDHKAKYNALVSGQADIMMSDHTSVKKLMKDSKFSTYIRDYVGATILVLNNSKPPLNDVRVRKAMALAWDQKKYINISYQNVAPYTETLYRTAINCDTTGYLHQDLKKARALIADYGKPVELKFIHTATSRGKKGGEIVQQVMKKIGVKVIPVPMDYTGILMELFGGSFDMTSWVTGGGYDLGPMTFAYFHSRSFFNVTRYSSKEVDELLIKQRKSPDQLEREQLLCEINQKINFDAPFIYFSGIKYYLFARNNVKNIKKQIPGDEGMWGGEFDIWLDQ